VSGVVTISASYGAGGAVVGRAVADRLGLDFFDRAIPVAVADRLAISAEEAIALDEHPPGLVERMLASLASAAAPMASDAGVDLGRTRSGYRAGTEEILRQIADGAGGVVLGRAAMVVLAGRSDVLSVRLDGPADRRVAQAVRLHAGEEATARAEQRNTDRAREAYVRIFYGTSQGEPSLYHLVIDSTAIELATCADIVVTAARSRLPRDAAGRD